MKSRLERYFQFQELGTNWRTEILAGATTFVTMAYIIFVNPSILHETGMPLQAVVAATCLCAAFGSILMGVLGQTALGAVFLSGIAFLILTAAGVRQMIISAIPFDLYAAVAVGIGLFI